MVLTLSHRTTKNENESLLFLYNIIQIGDICTRVPLIPKIIYLY